MKRLVLLVMAFALVFMEKGACAQDNAKKEIEELKSRIESLEKRAQEKEVTDELGHKLHPIHSLYGLKISGGVTVTAQGTANSKTDNQRGALALSADIVLESPVGKDGRVVGVLDFQRGEGLTNLPSLFTSPNDGPTGTNADVESFNNDQVHVTQFYYEHDFSPRHVLSVGQLDITGYFDANNFANNERTQFLANLFVNNPAIEFGGSEDFYSPGLRFTCWPTENFDISLGVFDGDGDYSQSFDKPFMMAEANYKAELAGLEGNYRIYYWNRQGRPSIANTANPNDDNLLRAENKGVGISLDQMVADNVGVWLRAGKQREKVAQFDRFVGGGVHLSGDMLNRPNDSIGIGYGVSLMGQEYKDFKKSAENFDSGAEHYMEAYYDLAVDGATDISGLHIAPDIQYVVNPGGDTNADKVFIYGIRLQAFF